MAIRVAINGFGRIGRTVFRIEKNDQGWNITQLIKARTPDPDEPKNRRPIEIGEIGVSDRLVGRAAGERRAKCPLGAARVLLLGRISPDD